MTMVHSRVSVLEWTVMLTVSGLMVALTWFQFWSLNMTEVLGFATGGICVWLVVRENMLNWPIGLANNVFFFVLFLQARLYADMSLQIVYLGLGLYGWWNWLRGGVNHEELTISRTRTGEWIALAVFIPFATWLMVLILTRVNDASPFLDGLTTVLSLAAQFLLCRKRLENWFFWIAADLIFVPLYFSRGLPLTAILYAIFIILCIIGFRQWSATWKQLRPS